jgi:hypothetical protein
VLIPVNSGKPVTGTMKVKVAPDTQTVGTRLPRSVVREIQVRAHWLGLSPSRILQDAILDWIVACDRMVAQEPRENPTAHTEASELGAWRRVGARTYIHLAGRLAELDVRLRAKSHPP